MNDMTDFDKLIKEKAEQAAYPYEESAWRQYKRKAGLQNGYAKYWLIGASSIVLVGAFLLLRPNRLAQPMPEKPLQTTQIADDDSVLTSQESLTGVSEDTMTLQAGHLTDGKPLKAPYHQLDANNDKVSRIVKDTPKVSRKEIFGRPVVIDVDTITRMVPTDEELEKGHSRLF